MALVTIKRVTRDTYSREETIAEIQVEAIRVQPYTKVRVGSDGEALYTSIKIFFEPGTDIRNPDKILHNGRELTILSLYEAPDLAGNISHIELEA